MVMVYAGKSLTDIPVSHIKATNNVNTLNFILLLLMPKYLKTVTLSLLLIQMLTTKISSSLPSSIQVLLLQSRRHRAGNKHQAPELTCMEGRKKYPVLMNYAAVLS